MNEKRATPAGGSCTLLSCEVCCSEIPQSEALNAEAADYIFHFCAPACFARFDAARVPKRARKHLTIGKPAQPAGVGAETIRFYERKGLITQPVRPAAGAS